MSRRKQIWMTVISIFILVVCWDLTVGVKLDTKSNYRLAISYADGHVWKTDVLNWPAGQPLNLTCSIRKIREEDDNQIRDENNASSLHAHCGKYTSSFRDDGCAWSISRISNVNSCWKECTSHNSYNILWKSDEIGEECNCIDETVNVNTCIDGEFEYYNQNPVDCSSTGNIWEKKSWRDSYNLTWKMTDPLRQGLTTDIKERGSLHLDSYPYLSPWSFQHSTGSQLIILDPGRTRHTGKYVCQALPIDNGRNQTQLEPLHAEILVNILVDRPTCGADNYRCSNDERHCIFHRFLCDGVPDCTNSEDESVSVCGPGDPCTGKIRCDGGRCMDPKDCCDPQLNASCLILHPCCQAMIESNRRFYRKGMTDSHDMRLIQSTIYTIIGCVVAFMFILVLIALAICRFHAKRRWSFRYYTNSGSSESDNTNLPPGGRIISSINIRPSRRHQRYRRGHQSTSIRGASRPHPPITLHDLDIYFSSLRNVDSTSGNGGSTAGITYNINNGVQIVGAPPPYSQAAGTDGDNLQSINAAADLPPPYRAEDEVAAESRNDRTGNPRVSPEEHNNLGVSIRRHVRRNRNIFASISNQRQGPALAPRPDLRNETREGEPLLEEVNNNAFNEGPVINNVMDVDGDDGNNNGDINGNSEMIDLHNRRLQEERERAEQAREREAQLHRDEISLNVGAHHNVNHLAELNPQPSAAAVELCAAVSNELQGAAAEEQDININMVRTLSAMYTQDISGQSDLEEHRSHPTINHEDTNVEVRHQGAGLEENGLDDIQHQEKSE